MRSPTTLQTALVALLSLLGACAGGSSRKPNMVLILADDLGWGDLGCYGGSLETPHLDALAAGGLRFLDLHSAGAVCSPTRASLLTGRYPQRAGLPGVVYADPARPEHAHGLADHERTLPEVLDDAGYATALVGKWHLGYLPPFAPTRHGFDRFHGFKSGNVDYQTHVDQAGAADWWSDERQAPEEGYLTRLLTRHALEFIDEAAHGPFFLMVAHGAPHYPYQGPNDEGLRIVGRPRGAAETALPMEQRRERYAEMVRELDASVGVLLGRLDQLGLREQTLVVFLSDNGANSVGSNQPWRGHKGSLWEGGHRVPGIASWPGTVSPGLLSSTAHTNDWMPTLLALAEAGPGLKTDGVDLGPALRGMGEVPPRPLFWQHGKSAAVRDGHWKLLLDGQGRARLFDLAGDPKEQEDLSDREPALAERLRADLEEWRRAVEVGATQQPAQAPAVP